MSSHRHVQDSAAIVGQHQEYIEDLEAGGRHREEIDRNRFQMVFQKGLPSLRRRLPVPDHVLTDAILADLDAEFEEFPMNPR